MVVPGRAFEIFNNSQVCFEGRLIAALDHDREIA